jgi:hypothetical protein
MGGKERLEQQTKSNHNTEEQEEAREISQGARIRKGLHIPPTVETSHRRSKFATRGRAPVGWRGAPLLSKLSSDSSYLVHVRSCINEGKIE